MAVTIPVCARVVLSGTATNALLIDAMHDWFIANPGDFTVENVVGSPTTSFTLTHDDGWQINYRLSGGEILVLIAPEGGIADSASPGTPTNAMTEDTAFPVLSGVSDRVNFAQYGDAVFVAVQSTALNSYPYAIMTGRCVDSLEPFSTRFVGLAHFGYLMGDAMVATTGAMYSLSGSAGNRKSKVRTLADVWVSPGTPVTALFNVTQPARGRFSSIIVTGSIVEQTPSATTMPTCGVMAYCRIDSSVGLSALNVVPSDTTDQGMLAVVDDTGTSRFRVVWNKNVTP